MRKLRVIIGILIIFVVIDVKAKIVTLDEFENVYQIERAYVVGNYLFDISNGYNPSLKDLLVASSYNDKDNINVYEIKITENINGDIVREYRELLQDTVLDSFPNIDVKYIYETSVSNEPKHSIDTRTLTHGVSRAGVLNETKYNDLNIERAYVLGEYIFDLDDGYNPSLKDLLIASTTVESDDIRVYEIKRSENINGDIVEEYNELLSFHSMNSYPIIKSHYIYSEKINNNNYDLLIKSEDMVSLSDKTETYNGSIIVHNNATSISGNAINYLYYDSTSCNGNLLNNAPLDAGNYSVKASTNDDEYYTGSSKCAKLTIVPSNTTTSLDEIIKTYNGSNQEASGATSKLNSNNSNITNGSYTYKYYAGINCNGTALTEPPTEVGSYRVKATLTETDNYYSSTSECSEYNIYKSYTSIFPTISGGSTVSSDVYLSLMTNREIVMFNNKAVWENPIEYDDTNNRGESKLTIKVDKDFIDSEETYYDITIDYYDEGDTEILLQTSTDENNAINYAESGYGCYVEESWCQWKKDNITTRNILYDIEGTNSWNTHTFKVNSAFFKKNEDNFIHLYFGAPLHNEDYSNTIKIEKITVTKTAFVVKSIDKNNDQNIAMAGNIYTDDDFGMGFQIVNASKYKRKVNVSYTIKNDDDIVVKNVVLGQYSLDLLEEKNFFIEKVDKYGIYKLIVTLNYGDTIEVEELDFSKIVKVTSNNAFVGADILFRNDGWVAQGDISDNLRLLSLAGIDHVRYSVGGSELKEDESWINNNYPIGRYTNTYTTLIDNNIDILTLSKTIDISGISESDLEDYELTIDGETKTGKRFKTDAFNIIKQRAIDDSVKVANADQNKFGNRIVYYELLNEWNFDSPLNGVSAEQYADIAVGISKAIKNINPNAKIVGVVSSDDIWSKDHERSYYSTEENQVQFKKSSWMARVFATKYIEGETEKNWLSYIDAISLHIYSYFEEKTPSENYFQERVSGVRKLIEYYNTDGKIIPIIISETGYNSVIAGEKVAANNVVKTLVWGQANSYVPNSIDCSNSNTCHLYIEKIYWFSFQDDAKRVRVAGGILHYQHYDGIKKYYERDTSLSAKNSYIAMAMYNNTLANANFIESNISSGHTVYKFNHPSNNKTIFAVWSNEQDKNISINVENLANKNISIYDIYGNKIGEYISDSNNLNIAISSAPKYIIIDNS